MPAIRCPWEGCKSEAEGKCTKKDGEEITLEKKTAWMGDQEEVEVLICKNYEWPESALQVNPQPERRKHHGIFRSEGDSREN